MTRDPVIRDPVLWLASGWRATALMLAGLQATHLLFESVRTDAVLEFRDLAEYAQFKADEVLRMMLSVPVLGLALHAALRIPARARWSRPARYLVMSAAAALGAGVMSFALPWPLVAVQVGASASELVWFWYTLWMNALVAVLALEIAQRLQARRGAIEQLARLREHGRLVRQRLASSQLQAIQARVDPELLFDILGTVRRFYQHDAAAAERLLDELTAFLRAALPRLWHARSTLEVEFGLVACLGRLLRSAGQGGFDVTLDLPGQLAGTAFPAGLLLPLLSRRAHAGAKDRHDRPRDPPPDPPHAPPHGGPAGRGVQLSAVVTSGLLHVQLRDDAVLPAPAIARLRQTLADLYGDQAQARAEAAGAGTRLDLAVPLETTSGSAAATARSTAGTATAAATTTAGTRLESAP